MVACRGCGDCEVTVDCCENALPATLFCELAITSKPGPDPDDCDCIAGVYPLTWTETTAYGAGWSSGFLDWPCWSGKATFWKIDLICLTSVWTLFITLYDADFNDTQSYDLFAAEVQECDPFELVYENESLFDGDCIPGLVPNIFTVTVTE